MKDVARIRVCVVATHFAEYAFRFASAMSFRADVLLIVNSINFELEVSGLDVPFDRLRVEKFRLYTKHGFWPTLVTAAGMIRRFNPDIIHFEEVSNVNPAIIWTLVGRSVPVALRVHDPDFHPGVDKQVPWWRLLSFEKMRRSADLVLVHGEFCRKEFQKRYRRDVKSLDHGVLLAPTLAQVRLKQTGRMLMFGRMEAYKGLDVLFKAVQLLSSSGLKFTLHLAGRGTELTRLKQDFLSLGNTVIDDRFLAPDEIIEAFQLASFAILPYSEATQSGVLAASFANGCPVIATEVGGLPEIVTSGVSGVLIKPNDPEALASAMAHLLCNNEFVQALANGAAQVAASRMSWLRIAEQTLAIYRDLLNARFTGSF